jgi:hypothetical protein
VIRRLLILVGASLLFWVPAAYLVERLGGGEDTWTLSGTALALCLVPGLATLAWGSRAFRESAPEQLTMVLGSTGLRLFGVLVVAVLLYQGVPPYRGQDAFLVWLLAFYLFTLALEMTLLLAGRPRSDQPA